MSLVSRKHFVILNIESLVREINPLFLKLLNKFFVFIPFLPASIWFDEYHAKVRIPKIFSARKQIKTALSLAILTLRGLRFPRAGVPIRSQVISHAVKKP